MIIVIEEGEIQSFCKVVDQNELGLRPCRVDAAEKVSVVTSTMNREAYVLRLTFVWASSARWLILKLT